MRPSCIYILSTPRADPSVDGRGEWLVQFDRFRTNYPAIMTVMPLLNQTANTSGQTINFGGVGGDTAGTQFALDALKQVQNQYGRSELDLRDWGLDGWPGH